MNDPDFNNFINETVYFRIPGKGEVYLNPTNDDFTKAASKGKGKVRGTLTTEIDADKQTQQDFLYIWAFDVGTHEAVAFQSQHAYGGGIPKGTNFDVQFDGEKYLVALSTYRNKGALLQEVIDSPLVHKMLKGLPWEPFDKTSTLDF